ncbi:MAG: glycosyltransferase, partial [Planctomycetes bacterium]|nr:glycosyltransferase [Planctomycetota bacterium]
AMLHAECGLDYFVFPKGLYREIPPFAIGRTAWDNWLVMAPHTYGAAVVDGTEFITAVHQDHDYGHVAGGRQEAWKGVEAARNRELAGTSENTGRTSGATWILNHEGVLVGTPPRQPQHLTAAYRAARVDWLLRQADWLMAAGRRDLAACKQEESLGHQEVLIAAKQSSDASSDSAGSARLVERYATTCFCLAQCQVQMGQYEQAVASYSRLLENRRLSIPEPLRGKLTQQRDACARQIRPDRSSATSSASLPCRDAAEAIEMRPEPDRSVDGAAGRPDGPRPKVTVIAACHDAERHLAECLDSILRQTLVEWELFLLDDGSTDGTRRIIADYAARDARIRPFYFDDNAGPYVRRDFAIEKADAPFIVIQDADDVMVPQKLERLHLAITQDERLAVVGSFYHMFLNEYEGAEHCDVVALQTTHEQILAEYRSSATCDFCWHGSAIIRKRIFDEIGPYDENPFASDSFWLAKVAEYACRNDKIRLMNIPEVLTLRRMHVGSQTGSLPAFDPRSRRARFKEFRARRLSEVIRQLDSDPRADVQRLLREAVCSDFTRENGHRFAEWESAPLTSRMVREFIGRICSHLTNSQFVRCIVTSQIVEQLVEGIARNVRSYDLVKALAYFALGYPQQARECLDREWRTHGTPLAAFFRAKYVDRYEDRWTRDERTSIIEKAIFLGESDEPSEPPRCLLERGVKGPTGLSVIVSLADGAMPWAEMIASFNAQTEKDFEVIALTRGPVPNDLASVADSAGFRLVVLGVGQGTGWGRHRNAAVKQAEGRYVAFLGPHVLPDSDFIRCILQHVRRQDLSGLRGRIACKGDASCPVRFDLGPDVLYAACDIDEMCVFDRATFLRFGGFGGMPFDHGAIQLSCRIYADPDASQRPILYCPDVLVRYSGPEERHVGYVDSLIVEHRFAIGQLMQSNCLGKEQESDAWSFLVFVTGLHPTGASTDDDVYEKCLQNSLFLRKHHPHVAIEWAQKVLQGRPDSIKARCVLGSSWTLLGRSAEACGYLEGILAPLEELLGRERLDRVQKEFRDYQDIAECYIAACTRLAECYMQIGRYDGVAETYERLLANRHVRLDPAQRQRMEQMRDRLPSPEPQSTEGDRLPGGRSAPEVTDRDRDVDRTSPPTAIEMPVDRSTDEDEALDERTAQVLAELERKYRAMPRGASGTHTVAVKLAELFRRAGKMRKARALDLEAKTLSNALAFAQARRDKPAVCSHRPTIVEFNVITRCNGGCVMCSYGMDGEIVDLEQFKRVADAWLPTATDVHLIGGEVLLHPQFYELCEYANRLGVSLGMTTNLSTLAGRRAETIRKFFNTVRVSVDGSTRQTYESIRTRLSFDRLCRNLEILAEIRRDKPDLSCELAFVAMRQNIAELPDVIEMAGRYAFDSVAVNFVHIYSASALDDSLLFHRERANENFDLARAKAARLGLVLDIPNNFDLSHPPYVASQQLTEGHRRCVRPWQRVRVLINGDVVSCCHLLDLPMGNALTEPLEGVWNGRKLQDLRQAIKESRDDMPDRCKHCKILTGGTDSNDVMLHVGSALVPEMRERLAQPCGLPSSGSVRASCPSDPRVTVVTTCRNAQAHLAECLDGIVNQTLTEWELFLIDDGSTDDTRRIIEAYATRDARIRPFYFDDSTGPYVRRNFAIRQARAPFLSIQDADDIMVPQKLERLVEAIAEDPRLGVVGSFYRSFLDEFTGIEHTEAAILPTTQEQMLEVYRTQCIWDYLWHGSAIVRRDLFDTIGLYDENPFGADSFWLAKAIEYAHRTGRVRLGTIPEFLTLRRVHADSQTGVLPTMDPRSRRVAYAQYCLERLEAAVGRAERDPGVDLAHELRECTCSDFLERWGDQAIEGEKRPADDQAMDDLLQRALEHLRERRYVSCVRTLRWLEIMDPAVAVRVANFDLIHAIALLGLGHTKRGRDCLHREMVNHDNSMARQLHEEIFERGIAID